MTIELTAGWLLARSMDTTTVLRVTNPRPFIGGYRAQSWQRRYELHIGHSSGVPVHAIPSRV
jgi:hypothetical protein